MTNGFDRLATPYRWMEYLTFGKALQRCRAHFLHDLTDRKSALVLGDGDGRFAEQLLRVASRCRLHAVDGSGAMLRALEAHCKAGGRVRTYHVDLTSSLPDAVIAESFDLVATHFFLDCLTTTEVDALVRRVRPLLRSGACWVVSEFDIPSGAMRLPSALIISALYAAFGLLTGLRTKRLPDYRSVMGRHGLVCREQVVSLGGLLVAELWTVQDATPTAS